MWSLALLLIGTMGQGQSLTLEEALKQALVWNRDQRRAALSVMNSEAGVGLAQDAFRWQPGSRFSLDDEGDRNATFSADKLWRTGTQLNLESAVDLGDDRHGRYQADHRLTLSQPLLANRGPLVQEKGLRVARIGLSDATDALRGNRQNLVFRVVRDYFQVLLQEQLATLSRKSLQRVETLVEATRLKLKIGRVSQVDLYRAQLLENDTRLNLLRQETALAESKRALMFLLGSRDMTPPALVAPKLQPPAAAILESPAFRPEVEHTLAYRRLQRYLRESRLDVRLARRTGLPDLKLNVSVYADGVDDVVDWGEQDEGVSVFLSQSHNFRRRDVRLREKLAENRVTALGYDLEDVRVDFERERSDRVQNLVLSERRLELNQSALSFANEQLEVARSRFERGLIDNFDVIQAEQRVLSAGNALARSERDLVLQWVGLKIFLNLLEPDDFDSLSRLLFLDL